MINIMVSWAVYLIPVGVAVLISILAVVLAILNNKKKQINEKVQKNEQNNTFLEIFGGKDNIISCESKGSRLVLVLKDYDKLNQEQLKENGVTSFVKATNKITLIIGEKSKDLETFINENRQQ